MIFRHDKFDLKMLNGIKIYLLCCLFFTPMYTHVRIIYKIVDHACRFPNIKFWVLHSTYINTCLGTPATPFIKTLNKKVNSI